MTACPQCGSEESGLFCRFCGTHLSGPGGAGAAGSGGSGGAEGAGSDQSVGPYTQPLGLPPMTDGTIISSGQGPAHPYGGEATAAVQHPYGEGYQSPYQVPYPPAQQQWNDQTQASYPPYQQGWYPGGDGAGSPPPGGGYPPPGGSPGSSSGSKILGALAGVLAALLIGVGVWWMTQRSGETNEAVGPPPTAPTQGVSPTPSQPTSAQPAPENPPVVVNPPPTGAGPGPRTDGATQDPNAAANAASLAELRAARDSTVRGVSLDGRWVAQLASKYDGVVDPLQTTDAGSHTFRYPDILAEHQRIRAERGDGVILLNGTDFGRQVARAKEVWITLYDGGFGTEAGAKAWCASAFPNLSGKELANHCVPRSLRPPYR